MDKILCVTDLGRNRCASHPLCEGNIHILDTLQMNLEGVRTLCESKMFRITELEEQVTNLEEYMLKGVAFRDELQARIAQLEGAVEWACGDVEKYIHRADCSVSLFKSELRRRAGEG